MTPKVFRRDWHFCDIPIYRCKVDQHTSELDQEKRELFSQFLVSSPGSLGPGYDPNATMGQYFESDIWYPWQFNEIVGWIRLYVFGSQIRGDLWYAESKRLVRRSRRTIKWRGKILELHMFPEYTSEEIYKELMIQLTKLQNGKRYKRRHLDLQLLQNLGPYIEWRRVIGFED